MSKKSLVTIHMKAILSSLKKFLDKIEEMRNREEEYKRKFYSHMKAEVESLRSSLLSNPVSENENVFKMMKEIDDLWEKVESKVQGGVLVITRDPAYFWKKTKVWRETRYVVLAESVEEGIDICKGKSTVANAGQVGIVIVDPSVVERFDDLEKLKSLIGKGGIKEVKVME